MQRTSQRTRRITILGLMAAVSIILVYFIRFPIFPSAPFLEYDPADIPIFICTFLFGPWWGLALTVVVSFIQGFTVSAGSTIIGVIMHILATGSFALVAGFLYRRNKTRRSAVVALLAGVVVMVAVMALCNLVFTPIFMKTPVDVVLQMLVPVIIPFNLIKAGANAAITFLVYKKLAGVIPH